MADILINDGGVLQSTSSPTASFDQLINNNYYQSSSQACIVDLIAPTFSGIVSLINGTRGQLRATWAAGTDATLPVRYEVYVKALTNSGLFSSINLVALTDKLLFDVFTLPDGTFVQSGVTYYVGVRAIDGVGNRDSNLVSLNVVSTGLSIFNNTYESHGAFAISPTNQLQGTLWVTKNSQLDPTVVLGQASYQVYNKAGVAVVGLSETGITADVNGQYKITAVSAASLNETLDHYMIKVAIIADSVERVNYVPLIQKAPEYDISGLFFVNNENDFDGSFWVSANEVLKTTGLGLGSYQVFDHNGNAVVGMSESNISPTVNGIYVITNVPNLLGGSNVGYSVRVSVVVDSVTRTEMFPVTQKLKILTPKSQFSINALNQFQGTLWLDADGAVEIANLGTASYTVYDKDGVAVSGLTQTGITADVNGRFATTPVSAILLTDLTHYSVKVEIMAYGESRVAYKGFSLLGN